MLSARAASQPSALACRSITARVFGEVCGSSASPSNSALKQRYFAAYGKTSVGSMFAGSKKRSGLPGKGMKPKWR